MQLELKEGPCELIPVKQKLPQVISGVTVSLEDFSTFFFQGLEKENGTDCSLETIFSY